ncbi:MAG: hypothetical protein ABIQ74_05605, partial [Chitinophagales bacterium]
MHRFGEIPFVRIVIPFCGGILIYALSDFHFPLTALFILLSLYFLLQIVVGRKASSLFRFQYLFGFLWIAILLVIGNQLAFFQNDSNAPDHYLKQKNFDFAQIKLSEPLI